MAPVVADTLTCMYAWTPVAVPTVPPSQDVPKELSLFDTATRELTSVTPDGALARLYVCGITPYDATHLGHANTYLTFDLVGRAWRDLGLKVTYTQNVTDVDDPLLERAAQTGQDWEELAESQIDLFRSDMTQLRVIPPDHYIGAVESISCVVDLIEDLKASGLVYQVDDLQYPDWYFNTVGAPAFGSVGNLDREAMLQRFADNGGDPDRPGKRDPLDCLLWRFARPGEPSWTTPLGEGRPGWHIECTAIALKWLGPDFDVQGGGSDLVFPHHEMCAAEGVVATGEPLASAFVHSGMVALDGEKMSKSKGNLELVSRLRQQGADPMAIRLALLAHHYRSNWEWTPDQLVAATARLERWRAAVATGVVADPGALIAAMRTALRIDLDAPAALDAVDAWAEQSAKHGSADAEGASAVRDALDALLGIEL